ncbi:MAG: hemolysin family protein [Myxococcota bacterium]
MLVEVLVIFALILLNGVFAGTEIAVLTLRRTRVAELQAAGRPASRALGQLRDDQERFLATVQVGISVVGAAAAAVGGARLATHIAPLLRQLPTLGSYADDLALAVVVALVATLSLVLGELVPKSLALSHAERFALLMARPMVWIGRVTAPIVWLLTGASNLVLRLFGDRTSFSETRLSTEEVRQIVEEARGAGALEPSAGEIASRALAFGKLSAADVMVPRRDVQAVALATTSAELAEFAQSSHARLPVYEGHLDQIVGFVNVREALGRAVLEPGSFQLDGFVREVPFVPSGVAAPELLTMLQAERSHLAMVMDERGTVLGLVTIEDLVEELVGEIYSENDRPVEKVREQPDGSVWIAGDAPVHEVNRMLDLSLPESDAYTTIAGLCLSVAGRIPTTGAVLRTGDVTFEVVEATPRRVRWVRVVPAAGASLR